MVRTEQAPARVAVQASPMRIIWTSAMDAMGAMDAIGSKRVRGTRGWVWRCGERGDVDWRGRGEFRGTGGEMVLGRGYGGCDGAWKGEFTQVESYPTKTSEKVQSRQRLACGASTVV
eukprot:9471107-Pyramimonas_sp.AAC.2